MQTIDELREIAKRKLVGYTEKEIECFIQGALHMAGNLPQHRSEEWYKQQANRKAEQAAKADAVANLFKDVTGLGTALENIKARRVGEDATTVILQKFINGLVNNDQYRAEFLNLMCSDNNFCTCGILTAIREGLNAFNKCHEIKLNFQPEEVNEGKWTFSWDEPLEVAIPY